MEDNLAQGIKSMMKDKLSDIDNFEMVFEKTIQKLIKDCEQIPVEHASKNEEIATKKIDTANNLVSVASKKELLPIYNEAVAFAPWDSDTLALAFAHRSAVLTNSAMYEDSLKDIERALKIGYPESLKAELYARKAKNLLALNKKMCKEVKEAVAEAKVWSKKMDKNNKQKIMSSLDQLQSQSLKNPVKKWDDSLFIPKMSRENPKILRASDAIVIQNSDKLGRHIVAARDIPAGEAVMIHKAYAGILMKKYWRTYCSNCMKFTFSCIPCNQCSNVVYCDENCRDEAWKEYHDIECPVIAGLVGIKTLKNIEVNLASLRLFVKALKEYSSIEALYKKTLELDQIKDSIDKLLTKGVFDDTKYASVYGLVQENWNFYSHTTLPTIASIQTVYMLAATTEIFGKKITHLNELMNIDYGMFVAKLLFKHVSIFSTNSIMILPYDDEGNGVQCGGVLLPLLSLFSHSCDCNMYQYDSGNTSAVVAVQSLKKGEQLCISYGIYYRDAPTSQRRKTLMSKHNFLCECMACKKNWGPNYLPPLCLEQHETRKNRPQLIQLIKKQEKLQPIVDKYLVSTRDKSPTDILKTISELTDLLNCYGKFVSYPSAEIEYVKNFLILIYKCLPGY